MILINIHTTLFLLESSSSFWKNRDKPTAKPKIIVLIKKKGYTIGIDQVPCETNPFPN